MIDMGIPATIPKKRVKQETKNSISFDKPKTAEEIQKPVDLVSQTTAIETSSIESMICNMAAEEQDPPTSLIPANLNISPRRNRPLLFLNRNREWYQEK